MGFGLKSFKNKVMMIEYLVETAVYGIAFVGVIFGAGLACVGTKVSKKMYLTLLVGVVVLVALLLLATLCVSLPMKVEGIHNNFNHNIRWIGIMSFVFFIALRILKMRLKCGL